MGGGGANGDFFGVAGNQGSIVALIRLQQAQHTWSVNIQSYSDSAASCALYEVG